MPSQAELDAQNNASRARQQARRGIEQSAPQRPQPQVQQPYVNPYGGQYGTDSIQDQGYYDNYYYDDEEMTDEEWAAYLAGLEASQESQDVPSYYSDYGSRMPDGPIESSYSSGPRAPASNVGPQITDASQLREFMSGLNEQAQEAETPYLQYIQDDAQQSQGGGANQMERGSAGSPQRNYYDFVQSGGQMNDEQLRQANEMASSMGTTFDPETGYSRQPYQDRQEQGPQVQSPMSVRDTQDMLYERFGSPTVSGNMNPSMSGLETDAQGRMIPGGYENRVEAYLPYEQERYRREVNQANRRDFSTPYRSGANGGGGNETPDFRAIARQSGRTGSAVNAQAKILEAAWRGDRQQEELVDAQLRSGRNKQTANEEKADLIRQANPDLPEEEIAAITSGSVRVVQNPSTGETTLLNLATGTSKKVNTGQETGLNFDIAAPESTLFSRAGEYTGAVEAAKRKGQGITGQFGVDIATDASIGAAQDFETAQNELVRAFRDSARYSATEANQLKKELNIALSPFEDPKTAEAKLRSIDKSLSRRYKNEEAVALDENESIAKREDARSRARAILQFRTTLGVPEEEGAKPVEVKFDPKSLTGENQQAYAWATSNPSDPRSRAILAKLNSQ